MVMEDTDTFPIHHFVPPPPPSSVTGFLRKIGWEDILYKPVQPGIKGTIELQFYETLFGEEDLPREVVALRQLVPGYYHKETIRDRAGNLRILFTDSAVDWFIALSVLVDAILSL
jgi:hypothetical protein